MKMQANHRNYYSAIIQPINNNTNPLSKTPEISHRCRKTYNEIALQRSRDASALLRGDQVADSVFAPINLADSIVIVAAFLENQQGITIDFGKTEIVF